MGKKKIGIHNEPCGGALGGSEFSVVVLAEALAKNHDVEIIHHRREMNAERLSDYFAVNLQNVRLRMMRQHARVEQRQNLWAIYQAEREQQADLSNAYDLFITFTHGFPPYCAAPVGVVMVLFPFTNPEPEQADTKMPVLHRCLRSAWHGWKWRSRLRGYQVVAANSAYTRYWTRRRWKTDSEIVFPPVDINFPIAEKSNRILSVGRFAIAGHGKKQMEMVAAFNRLKAGAGSDWEYDCVGACGTTGEETLFFEKVRQLGKNGGANVIANLDRKQLRELFESAKIFWHAAGFGIDENLHPEQAEHFGISTVEAMAAGCVPVVINRGGQPELVEHGVTGFLWNTLEELQQYTVRLMEDADLLERMSTVARTRAHLFSREEYVKRFCSLLKPYLSGS